MRECVSQSKYIDLVLICDQSFKAFTDIGFSCRLIEINMEMNYKMHKRELHGSVCTQNGDRFIFKAFKMQNHNRSRSDLSTTSLSFFINNTFRISVPITLFVENSVNMFIKALTLECKQIVFFFFFVLHGIDIFIFLDH